VVASGQFLLEGLLDNLFQSRGQGTAEQLAQNPDITGRMDDLSIDPHLDPDPDSLQLHPVTVGGPEHMTKIWHAGLAMKELGWV
jgi:hypothetical protein